MATQLEDTTSFSNLWALLPLTSNKNRAAVYGQFIRQVRGFSIASMIDALDSAPDVAKSHIWAEWVKTADLSGAKLEDILALSTEPPEAVAHIVKGWLAQRDLSNYGLKAIKALAEDSAGVLSAEDVEQLWTRWITQKDLRLVTLEDFSRAIKGVTPEIQLALMNAYVAHCPGIGLYGAKAREAAAKHLHEWTIANCKLFGRVGATAPKFRTEQRVRVDGEVREIESVIQKDGAYRYWLKYMVGYHAENELAEV